jgi:hypothetical protein
VVGAPVVGAGEELLVHAVMSNAIETASAAVFSPTFFRTLDFTKPLPCCSAARIPVDSTSQLLDCRTVSGGTLVPEDSRGYPPTGGANVTLASGIVGSNDVGGATGTVLGAVTVDCTPVVLDSGGSGTEVDGTETVETDVLEVGTVTTEEGDAELGTATTVVEPDGTGTPATG